MIANKNKMSEIKGYYMYDYSFNIKKDKIPTPDELNKETSPLLRGSKAMREKFNIKEDDKMGRKPKYSKEELEYASKDLDVSIGTIYGLLSNKKLKDLSKETIREYKENRDNNKIKNKKVSELKPQANHIVSKEINQSHYKLGSIEPIDYIVANSMDFLEGNIIKYVSRYKHKNGLEDLLKAKDYLERLIEEVTKK